MEGWGGVDGRGVGVCRGGWRDAEGKRWREVEGWARVDGRGVGVGRGGWRDGEG